MSVVPYVFAASSAVFLLVNRSRLVEHSRDTLPESGTPKTPSTELPVRSMLPHTMKDWRALFCDDFENHQVQPIWQLLSHFFADRHNILLWDNEDDVHHRPSDETDLYPSPNGFNFLAPNLRKSLTRWPVFTLHSGAHHAARTKSGCDVVIRVIASGGCGTDHLRILQFLNAKKPDILLSSNHILPMLSEINLDDITFGVFPMMDSYMRHAFRSRIWDNSVGDLLYMILEALEAITYLHENKIAHQDTFTENFIIEWQPESLQHPKARRPRVFIIDFEDAVMFSEGGDRSEMKVPRFPRVISECGRPVPPEACLSEPYCPFRADVWQFGESIKRFETGFKEVTEIVANMIHEEPQKRLTAAQTYDQLDMFLRSQPSSALHRTFPSF